MVRECPVYFLSGNIHGGEEYIIRECDTVSEDLLNTSEQNGLVLKDLACLTCDVKTYIRGIVRQTSAELLRSRFEA